MRYLSILLILIPSLLNSQTSLEDLLAAGKSHSLLAREAVRDVLITEASYALFKSDFKPQIGLNLSIPNYLKTSQEIVQPNGSIQFQSISQNNSSLGITASQIIPQTGGSVFIRSDLQRFDDYTSDQRLYNGIPIRVGFSQPILQFNPFKWNQKIQPLSLAISEKRYILDIENIHIQVSRLFFQVLLAQENLSIAAKNKRINEELKTIADERYELGKISQNDLLQLSLEVQNAGRDFTRALYELDNAKSLINSFLQDEILHPSDSVETPEPFNKIDLDKELLLSKAKINRPDIIEFARDRLIAEREVDRAKKMNGIQADLFASYGYARGSQNLGDIYSDPITEQRVSLSVNIPLLDWGRKKQATRIAELDLEYIEERNKQDIIDFENEILQTIYQFDQLQSEVSAQKAIVDLTEQRYKISQDRFVLGDISTTDLTISQREKDQARRNYVRTLQQYWGSFYLLRQLTGYNFINNQDIKYQIK